MDPLNQRLLDTITYRENARRKALVTIMDSLRIMRDQDRISDDEMLSALNWVDNASK